MSEITIRKFATEDIASTAQLFFKSIHRGAASHYTKEQRDAWAPEIPTPEDWQKRLADAATWIAEAGGKTIGFMSLCPNGYLDLAFVHPDWIGKGVAARLYEVLEAYARTSGITALDSDASLLARPFLARQGWEVIAEQHPVRHGVPLTNFRMKKKLN
ncbi:GNAT family N-acetyltransferase [Sneathiella litorea]|uniref:GNAT family N-acetyltransferase n=1 Tax=Sneathiella litorea TaxID=2606216 RepID=A0A6L8WCT8_9PROT|nr:GNAT family N-acetyltransferase [Sneathiella litorea]MZR31947.1 GNAT family N-acetyltransferase [Sneathiella litorea]